MQQWAMTEPEMASKRGFEVDESDGIDQEKLRAFSCFCMDALWQRILRYNAQDDVF